MNEKKVMGHIFISDRREDSEHVSGRLYDRLVLCFGGDTVFTETDFPDYQPTMVTASVSPPANLLSYYRTTIRRRQMSDNLVLWVDQLVDLSGKYLRRQLG